MDFLQPYIVKIAIQRWATRRHIAFLFVFALLATAGSGFFFFIRRAPEGGAETSAWNLVTNPGFEEIPQDTSVPPPWRFIYGAESIAVDSTIARSGSSSLRLGARADSYPRIAEAGVALEQWRAAPITISFYTREENATGPLTFGFTQRYIDNTLGETLTFDLLASATTTPWTSDWRRHEFTVTPPKPLGGWGINFVNRGTGAIWIDDLHISDGLEGTMATPSRNTVVINETGETTVNGEPFFTIGLYHVGPYWDYRNPDHADEIAAYGSSWFTPERFQEIAADIAAHGFNAVQIGKGATLRHTQVFLDILHRNGLKALIAIGPPVTAYRTSPYGAYKLHELKRYVDAFRDHPAVLAWFLVDEPGDESIYQYIREARDYVKSLDPDHPTIITTGEWPYEYPTLCGYWPTGCDSTRTTEKALKAQATLGDILAPDPYPIYGSTVGGIGATVGRYTMRAVEAIGPKQAVWPVLEAFPATSAAIPLPDQLQSMTNQALIAGAKGLLYFGYVTTEHLPGDQDFFLPSSAPALWERFTAVNANTRAVAPAITAPQVPPTGVVQLVLKPGSEGIDATLRQDIPTTNLGNDALVSAGIGTANYRWGYRALLKFDLSSIPAGKKINRAVLRLYHTTAAAAWDVHHTAHGLTGSWDESAVTWNNQPTADSIAAAVEEIERGGYFNNAWYRWDVTKLAQDWLTGTRPNYGLVIKDPIGEITPVADELAVVGEAGNTIQVASYPTRYYTTSVFDPKVTKGWGVWPAGTGAAHHATSTTNHLSVAGITAADNYLPGKFSLDPPLTPCTKVYLHYEQSFNDVKSFVSSDSTDSVHAPELVVYYSSTTHGEAPVYSVIDNASEVNSGLLGTTGGKLVVVAAEASEKSKVVQFRIFGMGSGKAVIHGTGKEIDVVDGVFRDSFGPNESKTYFITPGASVTPVSPSMASTTLNLAPVRPSQAGAPNIPSVQIQDPLTGTSLNLVWENPPSSKPILCYLLYQSDKEDAFPKHPVIIPKDATSYTVGNLTASVATHLRLSAVDVDGNESASFYLKGIPTTMRTLTETPTETTEGITLPLSEGGTPIASPEGTTLPGEVPPPPEPMLQFRELFRIHMEGVREADQRDAVFYLGIDGKRYLFPHHKIFETWFPEGATVKEVNQEDIADYPIGGSVTYRPGVRMVKLPSDPKTYAVTPGGELRWIMNEQIAAAIYGPDWNKKIDDMSDLLFSQYKIGKPITDPEEYKPEIAKEFAPTIEADKGIEPPPKVVETYDVAADDLGIYPSIITVRKGVTVRLTFKVRPKGVYYGGREFRSDYFNTILVAPGGETTVEFLADKSFTYTSHRPGEEPFPATGAVIVK